MARDRFSHRSGGAAPTGGRTRDREEMVRGTVVLANDIKETRRCRGQTVGFGDAVRFSRVAGSGRHPHQGEVFPRALSPSRGPVILIFPKEGKKK